MSATRILAALTPEAEQIANWQFFLIALLGVAVVLALTWLVSDYGIDWIIRQWNHRQADVVDFEERRQTLRRAMGGR